MDLLETQYIENARRVGEYLFAPHGGLACAAQNCRRRARQRTDDRRRDRPGPEDKGARARFPRDDREPRVQKGLLLLGAGENTIRIAPPLMIDEEQADFAARTLEECIREVETSA